MGGEMIVYPDRCARASVPAYGPSVAIALLCYAMLCYAKGGLFCCSCSFQSQMCNRYVP